MVKPIILIILLLAILSSTTYAVTSTDDYIQCVTEKILEDCISVHEIQNFTNESIFNYLKDVENELPEGNFVWVYPKGKEILVCKIPDDFKRLVRYGANKYSLNYFPTKEEPLIDCPKKIENITNINIIFSLFSISLALNIYFSLKIYWKKQKSKSK